MQIQKIGTYTNKYSSNKNMLNKGQQSNTSNPNFGNMKIVCDEEAIEQLNRIKDSVGLGRIKAVIRNWEADIVTKALDILNGGNALPQSARKFNPYDLEHSNDILRITLAENMGQTRAGVTDIGNNTCFGFGESSKPNAVDAIIESTKTALSEWLKAKMSLSSEPARRSILAKVAKSQD